MPGMYTTSYTSAFSGNNVSPAFPQYTPFTLNSPITELSWPLGFQNLNMVVSVNMDITPDIGGRIVKMPDAREAGKGFAFEVNNPGNFSFNLIDNASNLIVTIAAGTARKVWLIDNTTAAGTWRPFLSGGGGAAVTSVNATSISDNITIAGVPIIGAGTIQFNLAKDLLALSSLAAGTGIAVRTAVDTWAVRRITGTAGSITVTDGPGLVGDININLSPILNNLTSIGVGNLSLSVNTISSTNNNGNIILNPQGTGKNQLGKDTELLTGSMLKFYAADGNVNHYISFKAGNTLVSQNLAWPTTAPANGQVLAHSADGQMQWSSIPTTGGGITVLNSVARYSNTGGGLTDSLALIDNAGQMTMGSAVINNIILGVLGAATITTQVGDQDLTVQPNGAGTFISRSDFLIRKNTLTQSRLKLYNNLDNNFAGIMANPGMVNSFTWTLPLAGGVAGFFYTDAANSMSITPMASFFPAVSTLNAVPRYSNLTGSPLKDSLFVISDTGIGTGLTSLVIGSTTVASSSLSFTGPASIGANNTITINNTGTLNLGSSTNTIVNVGGNYASAVNIGGAANTAISLTSAGTISAASPNFNLSTATASTSPTTGALTVAGGLGLAQKAYIGGSAIIGPVSTVNTEQMLTLRGPTASIVAGPHFSTYVAADMYPVFQMFNMNHNDVTMFFDAYYDGADRSSGAAGTTSFQMKKNANQLSFGYMTSAGAGVTSTWNTAGYIDAAGIMQWQKNITIGTTITLGSTKCLAIGNGTTPTVGSATGGGILYVTAGQLRFRGGAGTDTLVAVA